MLSLQNITKTYYIGEVAYKALQGVSLTIQDGDFVAIMGPSGSGKSTLMNIIWLLDEKTSGEYDLDGTQIEDFNEDTKSTIRSQKIGFIFQWYNLVPRKNIVEQVALPLFYQGLPKAERNERAKEALIKVGLWEKFNNLPNELSGGQQQRVAIARAIVTNPSVILADEPTGALDSKTSDEVIELLKVLNKDGKTIILITHSQEIAAHAKHIIFIKDGLITW
jgi:putative ABC transport system ATP-binding protein